MNFHAINMSLYLNEKTNWSWISRLNFIQKKYLILLIVGKLNRYLNRNSKKMTFFLHFSLTLTRVGRLVIKN